MKHSLRPSAGPVLAALLAVALSGLLIAFLVVVDDDTDVISGDTTTTSAPQTTTTTGVAPAPDTSTAVWPFATSAVRYRDPVTAARGFAVDYVGFTDPLVGEFMAGDARSGEVEIRAKANGAATTVFVRQLGADGSWWVLGSATGNIEVDVPDAGNVIASPVEVQGRARAFEGTVIVEVREDGSVNPIGKGVVTGRGDGVLGPFTGEIEFSTPRADHGALVFLTESAEDGRVWEAGALRVRFAERGEAACGGTKDAVAGPGEMVVKVFFTCEDDPTLSRPVAVPRVVPTSPAVLRAALEPAGRSHSSRGARRPGVVVLGGHRPAAAGRDHRRQRPGRRGLRRPAPGHPQRQQ